ncbi:TPA: DNA adenine methylase [Bacillus cereus]|nr:DNA adenine methylase [Bacillus cereus]
MEFDKKEINSPFRYAGGKFYARKLILEQLPKHDFYIEPFAGGASIFFAKPKATTSWLNDIDEELINCLINIRDNVEDLIEFLEGIPAKKELHGYYKNEFKPKNSLERAGRWYYLNRTSYSGIMNMKNCYWGYGEKYSMRPENWPRHLRKCSSKLQNVIITNLTYREVIDQAPDGAFLFVDPPYFNADQDKFYTHSFIKDTHYELEEALRFNSDRLKFLLTYDNTQEVRDMYWWCNILEKEWNYTISRTDDQTKKKDESQEEIKKKGTRSKGKEIFMLNYESPVLLKEESKSSDELFIG